ncbi:NAD(P)-dependent dehydrogenase, short-chain alcohol dehydrogenase family [Palleronia salina]|uniref:NAD(P)-dependent dehydrogenase, short-chain alcohol dehydrogenase family n=1 Tax=Palleronia salina TaxID=313368 RepID=A0A1M6AHT2_9RHOB|nr:SDR family oxidoreductase [Palleronia salina]SHI36045.1 NAD(P)-dependent dehydrogenase, short-chain alcohol dehydrogenase family [Palleronia salina]
MNARHTESRALILGGTQGVGLAIAKRLMAEGCEHVVITGRDADKGKRAADEIGATFVQADLEDVAGTIDTVDRAAEIMGRVDTLVVAGALTDRGTILDTTPELFDRILKINTQSPFFALQRVAQRAREAGHKAACVNILTINIHGGQSFLAPYAASKSALALITKNAASVLAKDHIRVNGINVGWMETPGEAEVQKKFHGGDDDWAQKAAEGRPMGKLVQPDSVAGLTAYLLSDDAGVMTGALIDFDQVVPGMYPE